MSYFAVVGLFGALVGGCGVYWLRRRVLARARRRCQQLMEAFGGKVLRHSPSGRVGRVSGVLAVKHPLWRSLRLHFRAVMTCDDAVFEFQSKHPEGVFELLNAGLAWAVDYREVAAALPEEVEAYSKQGVSE